MIVEAALAGAAVSGLLALAVPELIARIPEPEPEPDPEPDPEPGPAGADPGADGPAVEPPQRAKEPYAHIASRPALRPLVVVLAALVGGLVAGRLGWQWSLLLWLPLVPVLVALAVVDWRTRLLPTWLIAPTYVGLVALVLVIWAATGDTGDAVRAAWGWLAAGALFFVLWFVHSSGLGYGDVRLSGVLGIALGHLGWGELLVGVYAGFLLGGVGGGLLALLRLADRKGVPFGPFMVLGAVVGVLWGPWVWAHLADGVA